MDTLFTQSQLDDAICAAYDELILEFNRMAREEDDKAKHAEPRNALEHIAKAAGLATATLVVCRRKTRFLIESIERLKDEQRRVLAETE